jgi:hypothetical protein
MKPSNPTPHKTGTIIRKLPNEFKAIMGMILVILIPFILTLRTVKNPRDLVTNLQQNPTPHGYTWSLSLFIVPVLVLSVWRSLRKDDPRKKTAFFATAVLLASAGVLLDVLFGMIFFNFKNRAATLGFDFWGFTASWQIARGLPIEEIGFYTFGTLTVLLVYIWGDEFWFAAYNCDDSNRPKVTRQVFSFHATSAFIGIGTFLLALLYKKFGNHLWHAGFPGYFLFLTAVGTIPSLIFFPAAKPFINWRAFSLTFLFIILLSMFWEAVIAVPYQWWGFQDPEMMGFKINGFCGLPLEEPLLWMGVTWATIIVYETIYTLCHMESARSGAFGLSRDWLLNDTPGQKSSTPD